MASWLPLVSSPDLPSFSEQLLNKAFNFEWSLKHHNCYKIKTKTNENLELGMGNVVAREPGRRIIIYDTFEAHVTEGVKGYH